MRPARKAPRASPPMNVESTELVANSVEPKTSTSWRNHTTS